MTDGGRDEPTEGTERRRARRAAMAEAPPPEEFTPHRSLRDYALLLRERKWYVILVAILVFAGTALYTLSRQKLYTATATIEILRRDARVMQVEEVRDTEIRGPEDLNTQVKILESATIIRNVADRLAGGEARAFLAPYETGGGDPAAIADLLAGNRTILPSRQTRIIIVQYRHPDAAVAARVANLFVEEFMTHNARQRIDDSLRAVEDLKNRADIQGRKVQELGLNLQGYKERNNMVSLDQRKDIVTEKLKAMNQLLTQASTRMQEAEVRWNQVEEYRARGEDLANLTFIAAQPIIQHLLQQVAAERMAVKQLEPRYRAKHPRMMQARDSLAQAERELAQALATAAANVRSELETARRNYDDARTGLEAQQTEALKLDRFGVEYQTLLNELQVNEQLLASIVARMRETTMSANIETQNARVVDQAVASLTPSYPNTRLNLILGLLAGLGLGVACALGIAFIDDRVKSSFDIEAVVGLPLIGVIPRIRKLDPAARSRVVATQADSQAVEGFLSLHSNLRLQDESKRARIIIVTSTTPAEGKSFVTSNLALTFAAHGERTLVVDCDLRKPNVHRSFGLENTRGVIDYCAGQADAAAVTVRNLHPNLDVITAGGRSRNPTQVLNSAAFERLLRELAPRYDRIFLDTPPLAAVSDAMLILPLADGVIFTILFNHVRRKAAQFSARRLLESPVPCFGAVLNGLDLDASGYYYAEYYDKSYRDYYLDADAADGTK